VRLDGVHAGRGLVEEEQARGRPGRAGDLEASPVCVREAVRRLLHPVPDEPLAEERELLFGERVHLPLLAARERSAKGGLPHPRLCVPIGRGRDVLLHCHVEEEAQGLERAGDPEAGDLVRLESDDALPFEDDVADVGPVDAGDEVEEGGLAGAVRPDDADDLALVDVQV
jgi:hypothetical protein